MLKEQTLALVEKNFKNLNGLSDSQFQKKREEAKDLFEKVELPTTKDEEWKYTNIKNIANESFDFEAFGSLKKGRLKGHTIEGLDAYYLFFDNGKLVDFAESLDLENGLTLKPLKDAIKSESSLVDQHFSSHLENKNAFIAQNTALASEGVFIKIDKNYTVKKPIAIVNIISANEYKPFFATRNLIVAEEGSSATLIEYSIKVGNNKSLQNTANEIVISRNAKFEHYQIQINSESSSEINTSHVSQEGDSRYSNYKVSNNGWVVRNDLDIDLKGSNCETNMFGIYKLDGKSHVDNHTSINHREPHSISNQLYKGVIDGNATGVFNGKIYVQQKAQKTNAFQSNNNLLLSDNATINTKPQLEIWADDVKCTHGSTTGAIDEEALFYLRSRGISLSQSKKLLIEAFGNEVLDKIKIDALKNWVVEKLS